MTVPTLRKEVICRIVERQMQGRGLIEAVVLQDTPQLHQSACEQFGTWDTALQYAGVTFRSLYGQRPYTREEVLQKIRRHCRNGRKPTAKSVCRHDYRLQVAAQREFGSWRQALAAAGLDLSRARLGTTKPQRLTGRQVIEALRAWNAAGHSLQWCDICLENRALAAAARARFRSWREVTTMVAGTVDTTTSVNSYDSDQQQVIGRIWQRQRGGKPITYRVVRKSDPTLLRNAMKHFGGWRRARAAAETAQAADDRAGHSSPR